MTGHVTRIIMVLAVASALAGCGDSPAARAAAACADAAKERAEGKLLAVDPKALEQSAASEGKDALRLRAPVTFDTGLQSQYTQTLDCRVKLTDGKAQVIGVTFVF